MSRTSQRRTLALERDLQVWDLRKAGLTFREIAQRLMVSVGAVHKAYWRAYDRLQRTLLTEVDAERRLSLERLDGLIAAHYPLAVGCPTVGLPPSRPSVESAAIVLKCEERRGNLLGLDARPKLVHEHGASVAHREQDIRISLETKLARLAATLKPTALPQQSDPEGVKACET